MKPKLSFASPYLGLATRTYSYVCTSSGDYSVVIQLRNPVVHYTADAECYYQAIALLNQVVSILGSGHSLQKLDVFCKKQFSAQPASDFLDKTYIGHFEGRPFSELTTYLVLTKHAKRNRFFNGDETAFDTFMGKVEKILSVFATGKLHPIALDESAIRLLIRQMMTLHFQDGPFAYHNLACSTASIQMGEHSVKSTTLIDVEQINLPASVRPFTEHRAGFPVDMMHFLSAIHGYEVMVYHQVLRIPSQENVLQQLRMKRKRHESIPDPANLLCVADIDALLNDVAAHALTLVQAHFNIVIKADAAGLRQASGDIESRLFKLGIMASRSDANQLELFRTILPGNAGELKPYDLFLTSSSAALCLWHKERFPADEPSSFQISFTNRAGIPIAIDTNEVPLHEGRINNRNKFVLGPSGSGKSFFMNHLVRQYFRHDMDVVLVDTGHSYEGLCRYFGGQYITYSEDRPITMNPFRISKNEFNEEKREFLKALTGLLWKGTEGTLSQIEDTMLGKVILQYYEAHWSGSSEVESLCFTSFYTYSVHHIAAIAEAERIPFDLETYRFVLKKFCAGGHYEHILNKDMEASLFDAPFIVFEIDAIKEHKILFPVTTLIIMDVFLQKMRLKSNRKCLIIEEAWKAIASPMMAGYILYLYKTIRKFRGEAIVVTQELDDIIGNQIVKDSIISNSDTICLLDQSKFRDRYGDIARLLALNEVEQRKIFTINALDNKDGRGRFKEVYIKRGSTGEVYGVEVSLEEYLTYTTERAEKEAVQRYVRRHPDMASGLTAFVNDFRCSGMDLTAFCHSIHSDKSHHENI